MAASELRRLAERIPEVADELQLMARQLDAEADELTSDSEPSPTV
jgi:methyl-accepting chemotaxis protein